MRWRMLIITVWCENETLNTGRHLSSQRSWPHLTMCVAMQTCDLFRRDGVWSTESQHFLSLSRFYSGWRVCVCVCALYERVLLVPSGSSRVPDPISCCCWQRHSGPRLQRPDTAWRSFLSLLPENTRFAIVSMTFFWHRSDSVFLDHEVRTWL